MATIAQQEKHDRLKHDLTSGGYKTLTDVILDRVGRGLQKLLRRPRSVSFWYSGMVVCLLIFAMGFVVSASLGEVNDISQRTVMFVISGNISAYISLIIFKLYIDYVRAKLVNDIVDAVIREDNIVDLQHWLELLCNVRLHFLFCLIYGLVLGIYAANQLSGLYREFIGYGPTIVACLVVFIWGIPMYFLFVFLVLPVRLSRFDYRLYTADPRNSEVIAHLSSLFIGSVYLYAIVATGSTFFLAHESLFSSTLVISIFVAWLPIALLFFTSQYALRKIITRGKWITLKGIQDRIDRIQSQENLAEKETMEKINRLMDYHDRVLRSKNSALDIRSGLDFLNSLLLPVVGSLLGSIDELWMMLRNLFR